MRHTFMNVQARCPACQHALDTVTDFHGNAAPRPGDMTMCIYCSMVCAFKPDMTLRAMSIDEIEALPSTVKKNLRRWRAILTSPSLPDSQLRTARR